LFAKVDSEGCREGEPSGRVKIKGLCGDVLLSVAQTRPPIDAGWAKKDRFRMKISYVVFAKHIQGIFTNVDTLKEIKVFSKEQFN